MGGDNLSENMQRLLQEFRRINAKGFIKGVSNSTGSIGITFEKELGNNENNLALPDYKDIEIKCSGYYNAIYPITLFSLSFDGPSENEMIRLVNTYGHYDKTFKKRKVIYSALSCQNAYLVNNMYYFKLEICDEEERVYLAIYDINNNLIEKRSYITFVNLKKHLKVKLNNLALVYALKKYQKGIYSFNYNNIILYKLKSFATFIDLLKNNIIFGEMVYRINKSNSHYGKSSNKNIVLKIKRSCMNYLFDKIYEEKI